MSDGVRRDVEISACEQCEHGSLLTTFVDFMHTTRGNFQDLEDDHEKLRTGICAAEATGTSAELVSVKKDAVASMSSVVVRLVEIDLLLTAVADMTCSEQMSDRCPKIDAILDFKFDV